MAQRDSGIMRKGLVDSTVAFCAERGAEAVEAVRTHRPDVVLIDLQMPVVDGITATRSITAMDVPTRVLVVTTFGRDELVYAALRAGASGYLLKTVPPRQLVDAVRAVAAGDALLAPSLTRRLIGSGCSVPALTQTTGDCQP